MKLMHLMRTDWDSESAVLAQLLNRGARTQLADRYYGVLEHPIADTGAGRDLVLLLTHDSHTSPVSREFEYTTPIGTIRSKDAL